MKEATDSINRNMLTFDIVDNRIQLLIDPDAVNGLAIIMAAATLGTAQLFPPTDPEKLNANEKAREILEKLNANEADGLSSVAMYIASMLMDGRKWMQVADTLQNGTKEEKEQAASEFIKRLISARSEKEPATTELGGR